MSIYEYRESLLISARDYTFTALIMAAMRKADSTHSGKLASVFPEIWDELRARYNLPEGLYPSERKVVADLSGDNKKS